MSSPQSVSICLVISFAPQALWAFDPFTAIMAGNAVNGMMGTSSVDDAIDLGDSAIELMNEAEVDQDLVREADANVKRLENVNRQIREVQYIADEVREFSDFDLSRSTSIASKLRNIATKIRQGKKFYNMLTGSSKQSNTALQIEQVKLNYQILDELRNMRLTEFNAYLEDKENRIKMQVALEKSLTEEQKYQKQKISEFKSRRQQ